MRGAGIGPNDGQSFDIRQTEEARPGGLVQLRSGLVNDTMPLQFFRILGQPIHLSVAGGCERIDMQSAQPSNNLVRSIRSSQLNRNVGFHSKHVR